MTTTTQGEHAQTEALRLADDLEASSLFPGNMRSCNNAAAAELRRLHAQVTELTAALGVQADPVKDEATCQMCGENPYPGCNSEFQDEAACRFYHPATAQTALAHELFAAAQLAPGEGIEDAVSRIAAALTAAPSVSDGLRTLREAILNRLSHAELLEKAHYLMELNSNQARTIGELQDLVEATPAQPAAPQGVAYAEPSEFPAGAIVNGRTHIDRLESFYSFDCEAGPLINCDDWHGLKRCFEHLAERASNGQAPAGAAFPPAGCGIHPLSSRACERGTKSCVVQHDLTTTAQAAPAAGAVAGQDEDDSLMLCASDLEHSAIYDNHVEMQSCIRAVAARMRSLAAAPTPAAQADSQPTPVQDYTPLPECQGKIFDDGYWIQNKLGPKHCVMGGAKVWLESQVHKAIDADRAARAPADSVLAECGNCFEGKSDFDHVCKHCGGSGKVADSVLDDAARGYELVGYINRGIEYHNKGKTIFHIKPTQNLKARWWTPDIAVYAARKQGAKHD